MALGAKPVLAGPSFFGGLLCTVVQCLCTVENCRFSGCALCVCNVLIFDETSKTALTFVVAADGFGWQGSQLCIFGPLYKPFVRRRGVYNAVGGCVLLRGLFFSNRTKICSCSTDEYCRLANFVPACSFRHQVTKDLIPICGLFVPSQCFWLGLALFTLWNGVFSEFLCYNLKAPAGVCPQSQQNVATSDILQRSLEHFAIQRVA